MLLDLRKRLNYINFKKKHHKEENITMILGYIEVLEAQILELEKLISKLEEVNHESGEQEQGKQAGTQEGTD